MPNEATYYVIYSGPDSPMDVKAMSAQELARKLDEQDWGEDVHVHEGIPDQTDGYIDGGDCAHLIIIKGEIVVPKPVVTTIRYIVP